MRCCTCASGCKAFTTNWPRDEEGQDMRRKWIWMGPLAILAMVAFVIIGGEIVMLLWNWLLPPLFGWREITFWQAFGVLALCRILFGGLGWRGPVRYSMRHRMGERMAARCQNMTSVERRRVRHRMLESL